MRAASQVRSGPRNDDARSPTVAGHSPRSRDTSSWSGSRSATNAAGAFLFPASSLVERALGAERAPARRERKGSERRKVFAQRNPEGGLQPELSERTLRGRLPVLRCRPFAHYLEASPFPLREDARHAMRFAVRRETGAGTGPIITELHRSGWPGGRQPAGSGESRCPKTPAQGRGPTRGGGLRPVASSFAVEGRLA